ncbi:hypothetical protein AXY43_20215 [Clostridium sp. MF28]|uniref:acyltransferase n=1 Tax=Clostridium TaxID=1485 RepID=UPI000CF87E09|nr:MULTISPECIES: acyltransferase [Clostridium]AVK50126.1 hypothetical protein AXY43_20215 [Clostridium sp. MF28]PSM57638.1 acyltransferase [Clostridium diolis]
MQEDASLVLHGSCFLARGVNLTIGKNAILEIGNKFIANAQCIVSVAKSITIGDECLLGWKVTLIDGDGHKIIDENGKVINYPNEIFIGNHVWLASNVTILKKTYIPDNCVVAANSCVSNKFSEEKCIIGGVPAKVIKKNIMWSHDGFK